MRKTRYKPTHQLGVGGSTIGALEIKYVVDTLKKNRLSYGPYHAAFERKFARLHKRRFAIFCNSGTSAVQVAVHALKQKYHWKDGDEVLVPAITFIATSNVVLQNNLRPVFVDVERDYYDMDPAKIEEKITPRTRAIMPVHMFGQPCDMDPILAVARKHSLRIVEDSCETMFVTYHGNPVGSWGDIACYSTYMAHLIVTGVGGIMATDDPDLAIRMKSLMNHGRDGVYLSIDADKTDDPRRLFQIVARRFNFIDVGYSYRATEMEAALGLAQLKRKDEIIGAHQRNAAYITKGLSRFEEHLELPQIRPETEHAFMMYPIVIRNPKIKRDDLVFFLEENLIETRYMMPLLNQPVYKRLFGNIEKDYPVAQWINKNGFYVGCHQELRKRDLDYIVETFARFFKKTYR